jgi:Domain of unknown function (DUF4157)
VQGESKSNASKRRLNQVEQGPGMVQDEPASLPRALRFVGPARDTESKSMPATEDVQPLPDGIRRFLQPVLGLDPADIRVRRGLVADAVTDQHQADAVSVGEDVFVSSQASQDSAAQLGLLAHEFTHVIRQRQKRFVPPAIAPHRDENTDEEALALKVESSVVSHARQSPDLLSTNRESIPITLADANWNGLPAPWEPLPRVENQDKGATGIPTTVLPIPTMVGDSVPVQTALRSRTLEVPQQPSMQQSAPMEPDLDSLASQVYVILKRRLQAEFRRGS